MTAAIGELPLEAAIRALAPAGVLIGCRRIAAGDEHALRPAEMSAFAGSVPSVRRASGAARIVARRLLAQLGHADWPLPKTASGAPNWPAGIVGSLSHDADLAVAAIAMRGAFRTLGIDVEPAEALAPDLLDIVATPQERAAIEHDPYGGRLLFAAKEAVYKAVHPLDRTFLDHHDVEVDLLHQHATVRNGRRVELRICTAGHLLVLAFLRDSDDAV
jgi:4'-phosphopantetheinyl transferase EntD